MSDFSRPLGWIPDVPNIDHDYHLVGSTPTLPGWYLAKVVYPNGFQKVVDDQGQTSACSGFASSYLLEYEVRRRKNLEINLSQFATYALARKKRGWLNQDHGAVIADCFEQLAKIGCCLRSFHPDTPEYLFRDLDADAYAQCARHRLTNILRVRREDVKSVLASGQLVVGGLSVCGKIWFNEARSNGGFVRLPVKGQDSMDSGGHAICFTGYDSEGRYASVTGGRRVITFVNSWSPLWANTSPIQPGWGMFDEEYLYDDRLSDDFWTGTLLQ